MRFVFNSLFSLICLQAADCMQRKSSGRSLGRPNSLSKAPSIQRTHSTSSRVSSARNDQSGNKKQKGIDGGKENRPIVLNDLPAELSGVIHSQLSDRDKQNLNQVLNNLDI